MLISGGLGVVFRDSVGVLGCLQRINETGVEEDFLVEAVDIVFPVQHADQKAGAL